MNAKVCMHNKLTGLTSEYIMPGYNILTGQPYNETVGDNGYNITKQDYKKDYWFARTDPVAGTAELCRARYLLNGNLQVDSYTLASPPFVGYVTQITADYLTANATGGHVYVHIKRQFGPAWQCLLLKLKIDQDDPLILTLDEFGPIVNAPFEYRGLALNKNHTKLTVMVYDTNTGALSARILTNGSWGDPPQDVLIGNFAAPMYQGVGYRLETDVWPASPNYGYQVSSCFFGPGQIYIHFINPDTLVGGWQNTGFGINGKWPKIAFASGGVAWLVGYFNASVLTLFSANPIGGGSYGVWATHSFSTVHYKLAHDEVKTATETWAGSGHPAGGELTEFTPPATSTTKWTGRAVLGVGCVREPRSTV